MIGQIAERGPLRVRLGNELLHGVELGSQELFFFLQTDLHPFDGIVDVLDTGIVAVFSGGEKPVQVSKSFPSALRI